MNNNMDFNTELNDLLQQKANAIKAVYRDWGKFLVRTLKKMVPVDRSQLKNSIEYKITPSGKVKPGETIRLVVGVLNPKSSAVRYLRFLLEGTKLHFVPVKSNNRYTGVLGWAQRHKLIKHIDGEWVWATGKNQGKPFTGMYMGNEADNFFETVYQRYSKEIENDIRELLERSSQWEE